MLHVLANIQPSARQGLPPPLIGLPDPMYQFQIPLLLFFRLALLTSPPSYDVTR